MGTTEDFLKKLRRFKREHGAEYGIVRMGIFGSVARGQQTPDSDLDVYIESDTITLLRLGGLLYDLQELLGTKVDVVHKHKYLRPSFVERIMKEMIYV